MLRAGNYYLIIDEGTGICNIARSTMCGELYYNPHNGQETTNATESCLYSVDAAEIILSQLNAR